LGRIEGKLDILLQRCPQCQDDLDKRLRSLEYWKAWTLGGAAAIATLITLLAKFFT
jgi:hypothetical protein